MKLELRKISKLAVCKLFLLTGIVGYAQASNSTIPTNLADIQYSKETFFDLAKGNEEDTDKLINNVKVFYNPISEQISVTFKLSKLNNITIKVMDALGNEVMGLHNGSLDAGLQNLSFDVEQKLSAGFYFVRVSGGTETIVKRISIKE